MYEMLDAGQSPASNSVESPRRDTRSVMHALTVPLDTLYTGMDGTYHTEEHGFPLNQLQVDIHDVDGPAEGGEFTDVTLIIKDFEFEGGKGWYSGHAEINVPDIIVKKK